MFIMSIHVVPFVVEIGNCIIATLCNYIHLKFIFTKSGVVFIDRGHYIFFRQRIMRTPTSYFIHTYKISARLSIALLLMVVVYFYIKTYVKRRSIDKGALMVKQRINYFFLRSRCLL